DSAPGKALPGELDREEALELADQIIEAQVPYVMLVGGEPTIAPYFFELAQKLADGGVLLKIETNGNKFGDAQAAKLPKEAIRSLQISIDGATQAVYSKQRPGGALGKAKNAARAGGAAGLPLEITF